MSYSYIYNFTTPTKSFMNSVFLQYTTYFTPLNKFACCEYNVYLIAGVYTNVNFLNFKLTLMI